MVFLSKNTKYKSGNCQVFSKNTGREFSPSRLRYVTYVKGTYAIKWTPSSVSNNRNNDSNYKKKSSKSNNKERQCMQLLFCFHKIVKNHFPFTPILFGIFEENYLTLSQFLINYLVFYISRLVLLYWLYCDRSLDRQKNLYIQLVKVLSCKQTTSGKQLLALSLEVWGQDLNSNLRGWRRVCYHCTTVTPRSS